MSFQPHYFNKQIYFLHSAGHSSFSASQIQEASPEVSRQTGQRSWTNAFYFHWVINPAREHLYDCPLQRPQLSGGEGGPESKGAVQSGGLLHKIGTDYRESLIQKSTKSGKREAICKQGGRQKRYGKPEPVKPEMKCSFSCDLLIQTAGKDNTRKKQQQPSVSPLLISRIRKQSHAGKVNCASRSKTACEA